MKNLSLKLDEHLFQETEELLSQLKESRNRYINMALAYFNKHKKRELIGAQIERESLLVRDQSLEICREMDAMDYDYEAV